MWVYAVYTLSSGLYCSTVQYATFRAQCRRSPEQPGIPRDGAAKCEGGMLVQIGIPLFCERHASLGIDGAYLSR